ncbi:MAG: MFS transporter [Alphaproteobacteria bacterium]|nr:MFS transporter [Alphaproteobacteria bacterium]
MSLIITALILVVAIPSIAIDILLPALPEIATFFEADVPQVQFLLSSYTFIISTFAILYGPLIDRFGRKKMALVGLSIFSIGSLMLFIATSINVLYIARIIQAIGGAFATPFASAYANDLFSKKQARAVNLKVAMGFGIAPIIGPLIGVVSIYLFGWKGPFLIMFIFSIITLLLIKIFLVETLKTPIPINLSNLIQNGSSYFRNKLFILYGIILALVFTNIFSFISFSPFIIINELGSDKFTYSIIFGLIAFQIILSAIWANRIISKHGIHRFFQNTILMLCLLILFIFVVSMVGYNVYNFSAIQLILTFITGCYFSVARTSAIAEFPESAGFASSIFTLISIGIPTILVSLISLIYQDINTYISVLLICLILLIITIYTILKIETD